MKKDLNHLGTLRPSRLTALRVRRESKGLSLNVSHGNAESMKVFSIVLSPVMALKLTSLLVAGSKAPKKAKAKKAAVKKA